MKQAKKATVAACEYVKEWNSAHGTMHQWAVTMDNGDTGENNTKDPTQAYFAPGDQVVYILDTSRPEFPKIKRPSRDELEAIDAGRMPLSGATAAPRAPQAPRATAPARAPQPAAAPANHDHTPARELAIIRQNALTNAVHLCSHAHQQVATLSDVVNAAAFFEKWVLREERIAPQDYAQEPPF